MKKRFWLIAALCLCLAVTMGMFVACDNGEKEPCTQHVDTDGDGKCDNCGEAVEQGGESADITDGIFTAAADASHYMVVRFKQDGTFYANDMMMQTAYQGKYEVIDMEITYIDAGADDMVNWKTDEGGNKVTGNDGNWIIDESPEPIANKDTVGLKSTKAVRFFEMDGTTPFVVNDAGTDHQFYSKDTPSNVVAFTEGKLHNVMLGTYTRTLRQDADSDFSDDDEIRNLLYELMPEELPQWAIEANEEMPDAPYTVQDLSFRIYHNGYDDLMTGEVLVSGTYTTTAGTDTNTTVYTLSEGGTLTLTVNGDDYSAVYKNGDKEIEMVKWQKAQTGATVMKELTTTAKIMNAIDVDFKLSFMSDCTAVMSASLMGKDIEITANWELTMDGKPSVSFKNVSQGKFEFTLAADVSFTWTGDLSESAKNQTVVFTMPASELADLQGAQPAVSEKLSLTAEDVDLGIGGMKATFTLKFMSDGKVVLAGSLMGSSIEFTADWALSMSGTPSVTFTNSNGGTFAFGWGANSTVEFTWHGKLSSSIPADTSIVFSAAVSELAKLQ